jgi:hypothetical protein
MLFITIQDGPALDSILGQGFKGYNGCVRCMYDSGGIWLKHCNKVVYCEQITHTDGIRKLLMGQLRIIVPQRFVMGNKYFIW